MKRLLHSLFLLLAFTAQAQLRPDGATASFRGSLPPKPTAPLTAEQESEIERELKTATSAFAPLRQHPRAADVEIFLKAVRYALDFDEWYDKKPEDGMKKAKALLSEANKRIEGLKSGEMAWLHGSGQKVLGFYSRIDGSAQPYGVEIPEGTNWNPNEKKLPMWIWLHGRGDTATDLHFVYSRLTAKKPGQFQPKGTIVIHPFGRYCNGWKSAGETDVFEARDDAVERFNVDPDRIALAGFSMGGAGAWHLGAHFADQWACVHTGAGFVDVKRYQKLTPDKMPVWYEQTLWGVYDVPAYARNFFNMPLVCYSGEQDSQRDSAEYMVEVLGQEGLKPPHFIGPGVGHKYHPETLQEVQSWIEKAVMKGRNRNPRQVTLQTRCTRYGKMFWVEVTALREAWQDTRVDAEIDEQSKKVRVKTKNVAALRLDLQRALNGKQAEYQVLVDGQAVQDDGWGFASPKEGHWEAATVSANRKGDGFDGPADQVFQDRFIIVLPDGPCATPAVDAWVKAESSHFIQRWRSLMRGDPILKKAAELTEQERRSESGYLCLWGDPKGNSLLSSCLQQLPLRWNDKTLAIGGKEYDAATHVPMLAYQWRNGRIGRQRIVLNSGLTFREAHDRTNSLQNPKLPDWAVLDITTPPSADAAGKVVAADFFDSQWRVKVK